MISSPTTSSAERTNPLRTLHPEDSRAPTVELAPRAFNGELPTENSGKRVRPDATVRGIGPNDTADRTSPTIQVRSSELECLSELHSVTGELQIPWMRNDFKFVLAVGGGAFLLVISMLMVMSRASVGDAPPPAAKVSVTSAPADDPSAALNAAAKSEAAPAQESQAFAPAQVKSLLDEEAAAASEPPVAKKARVGARAKLAGAKSTRSAKSKGKAKRTVKKTRARL